MAIFKVTAVPDFSQLRGEIARLQGSPVTLGVDTRQANVNIKATTKEIKNVGKAAKETSGFADLMGKSFSRLTLQMATWQMLGNAIAGVKRGFVEALGTMKSVDDEMVTIRKVTGASANELEKIEKQAYKTASAYGVAADDYLQFVAGFSRAGYGEQASALAELAAKTQIVGDTNAETAQQFLLSVDAAYKYQGNIEKLTAVLDGANEIDNRYATSIQKVAEGLGKVAPIAAQAHVGVDELTAAIGTITAVTQRSGTEAATALRALFLNIIGDTKTEIDEGVTWTTGEIAGLRDVIKVYAKDAYEAAQATGSVINPMKAIAGLSKSMKDGLLTEQQLMEMVSDIGGKLRTSQLLALIQNWDMYESMLTDFAGAAGSADKEVENALDSWSRKTEILKNKWTEFVSHLVETDTIKDALDGVIGLVEFLDSDTGRLVVQMGLLVGTLALLNKGFTSLMTKTAVGTLLGTLTSAIGGNAMAVTQLTGQMKSLLAMLPKIGIGAAIFAALAAAIYVGTQKQREYNNALEETEEIQSKLGETQSEYDALINKTGELTAEEKKRLDVLKELRQEQEKQLEAAKKAEWTAWNKLHGSGAKTMTGGMDANTGGMATGAVQMERMDVVALRNYREELKAIEALYHAGEMSAGAYYDALQDLNAAREDSVETIRAAIDAGYDVTEEQRQLVAAYDRVQQTLGVTQNATKDYVSKLIEEARQSGATGKALYDLVAAQIAASNQGLNFSQQIAALQELGYQAGLTAEQVRAATGSVGNSTQDIRNRERTIRALMETEGLTRAQAEARVYSSMQHALWTGISQNGGWGGSSYAPSGGGYSGGSGSSRKNDLDNAKKKAAQATIDAIKKQRDAEIEAIDEKIDALKKQNEEEERSKKLEELKLDILKKQDALLNARNERTVRQYNAATGQWEWVANPEKVKQAQEDLENAKKELREYEADVEREIAISELEARKKAIEAAYQLKIDGWQKLIDQLNGDVETEKALLAASLGDWDTYYQEMLKVYQGLLDAAEDYQKKLAAIQRQGGGSVGGGDDSEWKPVSRPLTPEEKKKLDKKRKELELKRKSGEAGGHQQLAKDILNGKRDHAGNLITGKKSNGMGGGSSFNTNRAQLFDSGGILKGMGGIKATEQDEMILPPDITARMTRLSRTGDVQQLFRSMRSVLFGGGIPYGQSVAGTSSTDRHDVTTNNYTVNGVPISPRMAKMPVEEIIAELTGAAHQMRPFSNG
nr:MAG TPA: minor tail protein [Caudoviricetes sp.]